MAKTSWQKMVAEQSMDTLRRAYQELEDKIAVVSRRPYMRRMLPADILRNQAEIAKLQAMQNAIYQQILTYGGDN